MIDQYDHLEAYCPQLGMMLTFNYCRRAQSSLPCRNLIGCWEGRIPVDLFLKVNFSLEELKTVFGELPKSRLDRILDGLSQETENQNR
jgi:hypothetical protein